MKSQTRPLGEIERETRLMEAGMELELAAGRVNPDRVALELKAEAFGGALAAELDGGKRDKKARL